MVKIFLPNLFKFHLCSCFKHKFDSLCVAFNCVLQFKVSARHFYICYSAERTLFHIAISIKYCLGGHFNIGHYYVLHMHLSNFLQYLIDSIGGIMVRMLALSVVDRGFEPRSGQTKDYKIGICCFSAIKHAALRRKSKDWLAQNQNNVSEWSNMLFQ